jgi:putative transposase
VVGWPLADAESKILAEKLLADTIAKQNINRNELTNHADNGSSMASKPVAFLLADLGVTKSHSRPHVCLVTLTASHTSEPSSIGPTFPAMFGSIEDARSFYQRYFAWYNTEHYHSGIAWLCPVDAHYGRAEAVRAIRADVLNAAYARNPERFVRKPQNQRPSPQRPGSTDHQHRPRKLSRLIQ